MSTQTEQALALLFRRFQDETVSEDELVKVMSLTLNWTKPSRAANLLDRGQNADLLAKTEDGYKARFDPTAIDVPFGFNPDTSLFDPVETPPEPSNTEEAAPEPGNQDLPEAGTTLETLIDRIAEATDTGRQRAVARVNAKQERLGGLVTLEVAALLVGTDLDLDIQHDAATVLEDLKPDATPSPSA